MTKHQVYANIVNRISGKEKKAEDFAYKVNCLFPGDNILPFVYIETRKKNFFEFCESWVGDEGESEEVILGRIRKLWNEMRKVDIPETF